MAAVKAKRFRDLGRSSPSAGQVHWGNANEGCLENKQVDWKIHEHHYTVNYTTYYIYLYIDQQGLDWENTVNHTTSIYRSTRIGKIL